MIGDNPFDQFTINPQRDRFAEVPNPKKQSNDEAKRGRIKRDIDNLHADREFERMVGSFDEIGG